MELNLEIIFDHLKNRYSVRQYGSEPRRLRLPRPVLFEAGGDLLPGHLYVVRTDVLPQNLPKGTNLICIGERLPRGFIKDNANLLLISGATVAGVFNAVQRIFDRFDRWERELQDLLLAPEPNVVGMIQTGMAQIDHSFSFMNPSLELIFSAEKRGDGTVVVDTSPSPLTLEQMLEMKEVCTQERMIRTPFISGMSSNGKCCYCYNLYSSDYFLGCVTVQEGSRPFAESDFPLIDLFFSYFEKAYFQHIYRVEEAQASAVTALQNLIQHLPLSDHEYQSLALQPGERWIAFRLVENRRAKAMPQDYMRTTINLMLLDTAYAVIHEGRILGLLRLQADVSEEDSMGYWGGLSQPFDDLQDLDVHLRQAQYAAEAIRHRDVSAPLAHFRDYFLDYMLHASVEEMPAEFLQSAGLERLRRYDADRNAELTKTLDYYLRNETNGARTAQALFIHRSSLQKRLDKIMELTGDDFDDPDTRLYYRILFRLQRL